MSKRKMSKADRKLLKRAGFGREHKEMGALACALEEVKRAPRVDGYAVEADAAWGMQTRCRVRKLRRERMGRVIRRFCMIGALYVGVLLAVLLLVAAWWEVCVRLMGGGG